MEKIKSNQIVVKKRINRARLKIKIRLDKIKKEVNIKEEDKVLLLIKNLTNNKLEVLYIEVFKIKEVKGVIILLKLLNIKIYLRFYISLLKKVFLDTKIVIIQYYFIQDEYEIKRILNKSKNKK